jgi:hypothetical protein
MRERKGIKIRVCGVGGDEGYPGDVHSRCRKFCCLELKKKPRSPGEKQMRSFFGILG